VAIINTTVVVINLTSCETASLKITWKTSKGLFPVTAIIKILAKTPKNKAHKEL
jgi:hypothetical protein